MNEKAARQSIDRSNRWIKSMLTVSTFVFFIIVAIEVYVVANRVADRAIEQNEVIYCVSLVQPKDRTWQTIEDCKAKHGDKR